MLLSLWLLSLLTHAVAKDASVQKTKNTKENRLFIQNALKLPIREKELPLVPTITCPFGYSLTDDNICSIVDTVEQQIFCPKNAKLIDDECYEEEKYEQQYICPAGYSLDKSKHACVGESTIPAEIRCPHDYAFIGGRCTKLEHHKLLYKCPHGYSLQGHRCHKIAHEKFVFTCPPGYTLNGHNKCDKTEVVPAGQACPHGFRLSSDGRCRKNLNVAPKLSCPDGFHLIKHKCVQKKSTAAEVLCDRGVLKNGSCVSNTVIAPTRKCPHGYQVSDDGCIHVDEVPRILSCPHDFKLSKLDETCTHTQHHKPILTCPPSSELSGKFCVYRQSYEPEPTCHKGYVLTDGKCTSTKTADLLITCPKGYALDGGSCIKELHSHMDKICEQGTKKGNDCVETLYIAPVPHCKGDAVLTGSNMCEKTHRTDPMLNCPFGYKLDKLECVRHTLVEAATTCPSGAVRKGDTCEKITISNPSFGCASGYTLSGPDQCIRKHVIDGIITCPPGTKLKHKKCIPISFQHSKVK